MGRLGRKPKGGKTGPQPGTAGGARSRPGGTGQVRRSTPSANSGLRARLTTLEPPAKACGEAAYGRARARRGGPGGVYGETLGAARGGWGVRVPDVDLILWL